MLATHLVSCRASGRTDKCTVAKNKMHLADSFCLLFCLHSIYFQSFLCLTVVYKCQSLEYNNYTIKYFFLSLKHRNPYGINIDPSVKPFNILYLSAPSLSTGCLEINRYAYMLFSKQQIQQIGCAYFRKDLLKLHECMKWFRNL